VETTQLLAKLQGVKPSGDLAWSARCPAHDDHTPSLSITEKSDRVLIHCHAGCIPDAICSALGITPADLFFKSNGKPATAATKSPIVATYDYQDATGKLLFQVVRFDPKDFCQRRPDTTAKDGWTWNTKGVEKVLFRLPETLRAIQADKIIFVCEGERDCLAMAERGLQAACNPGGAGKWQDSFSETLRGADVSIIADKDTAGRAHAALVAGKLQGIAASVRVLELPDVDGKPVKDAADFFQAGGTAGQIGELVDATPEWTPVSLPDSDRADAAREYLPEEEAEESRLPAIVDAAAFITEPLPEPPQLIAGILHQASKLILGGGSKSFKTWTLLDLALSVAFGKPWLGFDTVQGKVVFCNFEMQPWSWQKRLCAVAKAKGITIEPGAISLWNLRGHAANFNLLLPQIRDAVKDGFALIVLDPLYKLYGQTDENKASDVARLLNAIDDLTVQTGAAVASGSHFSKGNQAGKESIDRISGSGVFARDPDSLLIFTRHEEADAFTVESTLRNFAPVDPFVVRWCYPTMQRDTALDPAKLKQPGGRKQEHTAAELLAVLPAGGLTNQEWIQAAKSENGITERTFYRLRAELEKSAKVLKSATNGKWLPINKQ
jgi:hypothetical protein